MQPKKADEIEELAADHEVYGQAKAQALARLSAPFHLGGARIQDREALYDRSERH